MTTKQDTLKNTFKGSIIERKICVQLTKGEVDEL